MIRLLPGEARAMLAGLVFAVTCLGGGAAIGAWVDASLAVLVSP